MPASACKQFGQTTDFLKLDVAVILENRQILHAQRGPVFGLALFQQVPDQFEDAAKLVAAVMSDRQQFAQPLAGCFMPASGSSSRTRSTVCRGSAYSLANSVSFGRMREAPAWFAGCASAPERPALHRMASSPLGRCSALHAQRSAAFQRPRRSMVFLWSAQRSGMRQTDEFAKEYALPRQTVDRRPR